MAKFLSKYASHVIYYKTEGGKKKIEFEKGMYETQDKEEVHAIRKSSPFGVSIVELKTVDLKPEFKKDKEEKEDKI
jgi:hypothetical protein